MFAICVKNSVMLFNNFNNSRKADSKFNNEYACIVQFVVFKHLQEEPRHAHSYAPCFNKFLVSKSRSRST